MPLDLDYMVASQAIDELEDLLRDQEHGKRGKLSDEIIVFVDSMKKKYEK